MKMFEKKIKYLRKDLRIVCENTFTWQIIVSHLHLPIIVVLRCVFCLHDIENTTL